MCRKAWKVAGGSSPARADASSIGPLLVGRSPRLAVVSDEDQVARRPAGNEGIEQAAPLVVQGDVSGLTGLREPHRDDARAGGVVADLEPA